MAAKTKFSHLSASFTKQNLNTFTAVLITSMDCDLDFCKNCPSNLSQSCVDPNTRFQKLVSHIVNRSSKSHFCTQTNLKLNSFAAKVRKFPILFIHSLVVRESCSLTTRARKNAKGKVRKYGLPITRRVRGVKRCLCFCKTLREILYTMSNE